MYVLSNSQTKHSKNYNKDIIYIYIYIYIYIFYDTVCIIQFSNKTLTN